MKFLNRKQIKEANEMLEELEEPKQPKPDAAKTLASLTTLFFNLAISTAAIGIATSSLREAGLI